MIKNNLISDQEIFLKIRQNNLEALKLLYDRYTPLLYPIIKKIVDDDGTAEKVLAETFLIVWRWAEEFDFPVTNVFCWMILIARNKAIDTLKRRRGDSGVPEYNDEYEILNILPQLSPKNESLEREYILRQLNEIFKIVDTLSDEEKKLFSLVLYDGLTFKEIAEKINIPAAVIRHQTQAMMGSLMEKLTK